MQRVDRLLLTYLELLPFTTLLRFSNAISARDVEFANNLLYGKSQRPTRGNHVTSGEYDGTQLEAIRNAILDASYLAGPGLNAAASFS